MDKKVSKLIFMLLIPCALLAAGYLALMQYYRIHIPYGTWINGIYCTGMTAEEAIRMLEEQADYTPKLDALTYDKTEYKLVLTSDMYHISYEEAVKKALSKIHAIDLFRQKELEVVPKIVIDPEKWEAYTQTLELFAPNKSNPERMQIVETPDGFELLDTQEILTDHDKLSAGLLEAFQSGRERIMLVETDCYYKPDYTEADKAVIAEYEALMAFCRRMKVELTIQGETTFTVDASVLKGWMQKKSDGSYVYDKGGQLMLDEARLKEYTAYINEETTTYWGKPWEFVNHNGDTIEVAAGNYGRKLNTRALTQALLKAFEACEQTSYELEFTFYPESAAEVEYGAGCGISYIEVDIEEQHIYVYSEGELVLDSPCVTGDVKRNRLTPTGVFYIEYKQRNRTLRGENYATPVKYWMHFYNHCGFHDAGWRKKFGEDIYLKDGSHGCINMPPQKAKELYELVYKGMPVLIY